MVRKTVELRNPAMMPLSKIQVALLDVLEREADGPRAAAWQDAMLLSITGIAAGDAEHRVRLRDATPLP